jgi:hypothetical protein
MNEGVLGIGGLVLIVGGAFLLHLWYRRNVERPHVQGRAAQLACPRCDKDGLTYDGRYWGTPQTDPSDDFSGPSGYLLRCPACGQAVKILSSGELYDPARHD